MYLALGYLFCEKKGVNVMIKAKIKTIVKINMSHVDLDADFITFLNLFDGKEHFAIKNSVDHLEAPLVRLHSECITGDVFRSDRCDCGDQLQEALFKIKKDGGILLYLRQEGRGIGLYNKIEAYKLQDNGLDTFDANKHLNLPTDGRDYLVAAQMLLAMGVQKIKLLTNNYDKVNQIKKYGIDVLSVIPTETYLTKNNERYLMAKKKHSESFKK